MGRKKKLTLNFLILQFCHSKKNQSHLLSLSFFSIVRHQEQVTSLTVVPLLNHYSTTGRKLPSKLNLSLDTPSTISRDWTTINKEIEPQPWTP